MRQNLADNCPCLLRIILFIPFAHGRRWCGSGRAIDGLSVGPDENAGDAGGLFVLVFGRSID